MSLVFDLIARDGKTSYRVTIGRKHESTAVYEISTTDVAEARAFLLTYVAEQPAKVELTVSASGDEVVGTNIALTGAVLVRLLVV